MDATSGDFQTERKKGSRPLVWAYSIMVWSYLNHHIVLLSIWNGFVSGRLFYEGNIPNEFCPLKGQSHDISDPRFLLNCTPGSPDSILVVEYLREFESICKTVLAHWSGDPGVQFNEKTEGRKSRQTVPLRWTSEK
jgi:hypothetical protein